MAMRSKRYSPGHAPFVAVSSRQAKIRKRPISAGPTATTTERMSELWVFTYGSLMWQPGFAYSERAPAALIGAHRSLCIYSFHHRGTPERPGLVLGLDEGGACRGIAFCVPGDKRVETLAYLRAREQV